MAKRNRRLAARLWWATLPYAGWVGWGDDSDGVPAPWYAYPLAWLNRLSERLPGSAPFAPMPPNVCTCDYCRGVPGAIFEPQPPGRARAGAPLSGPQLSLAETRPALYYSGAMMVREADRVETDWMVRRHYLGAWPAVVTAVLGLYRDGEPVGVIVFSLPPAQTIERFGGLTWELGRLWVDDAEPRNTESWFIARAVRYVKRNHRDVVALVSYADPNAGHAGTIYRASNWISDGSSEDWHHDWELNGRRYARQSQCPDIANARRVKRHGKHRFYLRLTR